MHPTHPQPKTLKIVNHIATPDVSGGRRVFSFWEASLYHNSVNMQTRATRGELLEWAPEPSQHNQQHHPHPLTKYAQEELRESRADTPTHGCISLHYSFIARMGQKQLWAIKIHFKCPPLEMDVRDMVGEWCSCDVYTACFRDICKENIE